ncbi:glycosyltransferase [Vallitalea okinawensis]|uniref:glycosyltransferase n=1 Tax=Vallitalea okinawensis TaxID=2078660 RepID=UPI000CFD6A8A|nr:glycosyltransferase [Vallitalea okinawensis]
MHIAFFNPQGNFDHKDSYWTEHPDFGGQLVYVKELAIAMANEGHEIDIVTRRIENSGWKEFADTIDYYPEAKGVRIVRIPCGPKGFIPKEELWTHLEEWVENIHFFYKEEGQMPGFVTTHYGDGGIAGCLFKEKTGIPFSFTAHSLGAQKMDKMGVSEENYQEYESRFHFTTRIMAERHAMLHASICFVSTKQEREEQYTHSYYHGAGDRYNPEKFEVVPPGANTKIFTILEADIDQKMNSYFDTLMIRDIVDGRRTLPGIICSSRLDTKKYHKGLVEAYAKDFDLQEKANLVIVLRGVDNPFESYKQLSDEESNLMDEIMSLIDEHKLKGKVTFANILSQGELASFYRVASNRRSIFSLTAIYEPFGLAPIEAMACGLPVVVTKNGGPSEVLKDDKGYYGVLVDVSNLSNIQEGLKLALDNWDSYHLLGIQRVKSKYTWDIAAVQYVEAIRRIRTSEDETRITKEMKDLLKGTLQLDLIDLKENNRDART